MHNHMRYLYAKFGKKKWLVLELFRKIWFFQNNFPDFFTLIANFNI